MSNWNKTIQSDAFKTLSNAPASSTQSAGACLMADQAQEPVSPLPCPFCGSPAEVEDARGSGGWSVGCADPTGDCYGYQSLTVFPRRCDAIAAWNRRAPAPSTDSGEAGLREAFSEFLETVRSIPSAWETGTCCCGEAVEGHTVYGNHAPVDEGYWVINEAVKKAQKALAHQTGEKVSDPSRGGWLPIETAPKDGARIIGLTKFGVEVVKWHEWDGAEYGPRTGWIGVEQDSTCYPESYLRAVATYQPTLWQPLPDAPNTTGKAPEAAGEEPSPAQPIREGGATDA